MEGDEIEVGDVLGATLSGVEQEREEWCSGDDVGTHDFERRMT